MGWKANLGLAFLMATNCALVILDDEREDKWPAYLWGVATVCYLTSAGLGKADDNKKKSKDKKSDNDPSNYDIM